MILIIANTHDTHARHVGQLLAKLDVETAILDLATLIGLQRYTHEIGSSTNAAELASASSRIDFGKVHTIWFRRPAVVDIPDSVVDKTARQFIRHEWSESINGMVLALKHVRWVNHPLSQATASKPVQLEMARRSGLTTPHTIISNDPDRVREFLKLHRGRVVHKSLTSPEQRLIDTRRWVDGDADYLDACLPLAPVIFQELIEGPADIRTVYIDGQVFSVHVDTEASRADVDSRLDPDAECTPHELPSHLVSCLRKLMNRLNLVFGVVDMKLDKSGNYVFFEVNPQGQFLFMEILTGLPIAGRLAEFLRDGVAVQRGGEQ